MTAAEWMETPSDEPTRKALVYLFEQLTGAATHPCGRCGHDASDHRANDAGPPPDEAEFRCTFPPIGPPVRLCTCPDFIEDTP